MCVHLIQYKLEMCAAKAGRTWCSFCMKFSCSVIIQLIQGFFVAAGNCLKRSIKIIETGIGKRRLMGEASLRAFGCGIL